MFLHPLTLARGRDGAALLLFAAVLAWLVPAACQAAPTSELRFERRLQLGSGDLPVLSMLQDRQGYVWIGTPSSGLYRYDGRRLVRYANQSDRANSLPHDRVGALFQDDSGRIWVGTQRGLARFNPDTNDFTRYTPDILTAKSGEQIVKAIVSDGDKGMWLATWGGLHHFDPRTGRFRSFRHDPANRSSIGANDINAIARDANGGVWIATWPGGLDYLAPGATVFRHYRVDRSDQPDPGVNTVRALHYGADGTLWIGTEKGLLRWNTATPWERRRAEHAGLGRVNQIYADGAGDVWVGTLEAGLLRWPKGARKPLSYRHRATDPHSIASDNVRAIMQDHSGMLWVASLSDGISVANLGSAGFRRLLPFDEGDPAQPSNAIRVVEGAPGGRLWVGGNRGFALVDPASGATVRAFRAGQGPRSLSSDIVYDMLQSPDGPLWLATAMGLHRFDPATGGFRQIRFDVPARNYVNTVAAGSGGTLWLGTAGDVLRYHPADGRIQAYAHDPRDPDSRSVPGTSVILEDSRGDVWMGAEWSGGGLDLLDQRRGSFRHLRHAPRQPDSLPDDYVLSLHEDAAGRVWVGTAKGLSRVRREADGAIRFENGIGSGAIGQDKVFAIRSDAAGKLWVSTATALVRIDPDSGRAERYTSVDGLTDSFLPRAAHAAADGTLYFSGSKGVTAVRPERVRVVSAPARAVITDVRVFNRSLLDGGLPPEVGVVGPLTAPRAVRVPAPDAVVSVGFAALHYRNPEQNRLRYRLDGFDRDWLAAEPDQRSASYTNLAPGSYVFRVAAANDRGQWSEIEARLAIEVVPAFWQTWWFRALMLAVFAATCGAVYALRVAQLERSRTRLRELVALRTRELERSNARLEALALTDGLTGVANRRAFDAALEREWRRAQRSGEPVALALLDVDFFKRYNDYYGHQAGDDCLAGVAGLVSRCARRGSDVVARYGGEEFALIAPGLAAPDALQRALDICAEVARFGLPHAESPNGCVTVSVGVAVMEPRQGQAPEELVRRADAALYEAKRGGRNRAVLDGALTVAAALD